MNAEDAIIAKKRKRAERMEANPCATLSKALIQKKDGRKIKKTEMVRRLVLQNKVNNTRH